MRAKNPGGRPRKLDRDAASATAKTLFWTHGYEAVGVAQICDVLGVRPPSLYAAFGSKAGLFAFALDAYQAEAEPFLAPAFAETEPDQFVRQLLNAAAELYTRHDHAAGCLVLDGVRNASDPEAVAHAARHRAKSVDAIRSHLDQCGVVEAGLMADSCLIAMIGLSGAARMGLRRDALRQASKLLATGVLAAL